MNRNYLILTALFATCTSAVMLADSFREYEAELSVLVIPVNEVSAESIGEIVSNMEHFSQTDRFRSLFFDALSEKDMADRISDSIRRDSLEGVVSLRAKKDGSVLLIRASGDDADDAKMISRQAALALFGLTGQYYDLKRDIDLRIMSGPTVSARISSPITFVSASIALGTMIALLFFFVLYKLPGMLSFFEQGRQSVRKTLDATIFQPQMPTAPFLRDTIETNREEAVAVIAEHDSLSKEKPVAVTLSTHERKSFAPSNLPTFSEEEERFLQEFSFEGSLEKEEATEMKAAIVSSPAGVLPMPEEPSDEGEPTEEEYKRRLNELLRG